MAWRGIIFVAGRGARSGAGRGIGERHAWAKMRRAKGDAMLSGGVLGVVAPPLGEGVAEKATKRRDLPLERGEDFPLQKIATDLCYVTFAAGRTALRERLFAGRFCDKIGVLCRQGEFRLPRFFCLRFLR